MPIPAFTIDGVLPPYVGPFGPGGASQEMTPYAVSAVEVVATLGTTIQRKTILRNWLSHRAALRAIGFDRGFQWLDGSFVEQKDPQDLDIVTFTFRPASVGSDNAQLAALVANHLHLFHRSAVKTAFTLDAFFLDLNGSPETLVNVSRYYLGLFSHRRGDGLWKGMLQVRLESAADDQSALSILGPATTIGSATGASP